MKTKISVLLALFLMSVGVHAQIDRSKQPEPGPAPKISLETPQEFQLKNGIKVLVVENHKLPKVTYSLTLDNKPITEGDKAGVSSLLSDMLGNGTTSIPKDEFNDEIDFLGARLGFGSQSAYASSLTKYTGRILELMADAAINPLFTEEEFQKSKDQLIEGLKSQEKSVDAIASRVGSALSFGKHTAYGEFVTEETVNNITLQDVKDFYNTYFIPNNAYLIVVGDIDFKTAKKAITKDFGKWKKGAEIKTTLPEVTPNVATTQIDFVDMSNAVQSNIVVTNNVDLKMNHPDYFSAQIANYILGGGGEGYLFKNLREEHAYTYGAYSSLRDSRYNGGRFTASSQVRNAVTDSAAVQILNEINRIKTEPVDPKDLESAKAKYIGSFVMALEKPETVAEYALNIKLNNLPSDFYETYLEKINALTPADIQKAANKYFQSKNSRIIITGKGSDVLTNLEKTGIPVKYYDTYAKPIDKPVYEVAIPEGVTAESVLQNYITAIGGKEMLDKVNTLVIKYEAEANGSKIISEEKRAIGKLAQNLFVNDNLAVAMIVTPEDVFVKQGGAKNPIPAEMAKDMRVSSGLFMEQTILALGTAKLAGIEDVKGQKAYKIEVPGTTVSYNLFYDVETSLKVKETQVINMGGQSQVQDSFLKDYKAFEGILFPSIKESSQMGQPIHANLQEVLINSGVTDADFQ
ncbi:peptidase, M16 family [Formosa agariphila KMM 3901]|uniref:Peptidase, M16 family n=1 Tax=Formosa agariphila (strain DSM 15362 / KCTC 12365 / LMG 23005 / KMM 3901 / M-2Alg 35-1) TaxID=1347342 RepID=T2KR67_FORAG|nr:pitrilysin family protein [Formosa agariphila]CDF80946.1 peptidase, M16 family [Formosa agariphila KMM 3901]